MHILTTKLLKIVTLYYVVCHFKIYTYLTNTYYYHIYSDKKNLTVHLSAEHGKTSVPTGSKQIRGYNKLQRPVWRRKTSTENETNFSGRLWKCICQFLRGLIVNELGDVVDD